MSALIESGWFWIAVVLLGVLLLNVGLLYGLLSGSLRRQVDLLRRLGRRLQGPWRHEREAWDELHQRASKLRPRANEANDDG